MESPATRIYYALGGRKPLAAIGAERFTNGPDWLMFRHSTAPKDGTSIVRITQFGHDAGHAGHDTYRMDFYKSPSYASRGVMKTPYVRASVSGLYADQLAAAFTNQTGLALG